MQQLRAEARWYLATGYDTQPYATAGAGLAGYGNEWGVDTWGPVIHIGIGLEVAALARRTVVGIALSYRMMALRSFTDSTGTDREAGITQLIGIDLFHGGARSARARPTLSRVSSKARVRLHRA